MAVSPTFEYSEEDEDNIAMESEGAYYRLGKEGRPRGVWQSTYYNHRPYHYNEDDGYSTKVVKPRHPRHKKYRKHNHEKENKRKEITRRPREHSREEYEKYSEGNNYHRHEENMRDPHEEEPRSTKRRPEYVVEEHFIEGPEFDYKGGEETRSPRRKPEQLQEEHRHTRFNEVKQFRRPDYGGEEKMQNRKPDYVREEPKPTMMVSSTYSSEKPLNLPRPQPRQQPKRHPSNTVKEFTPPTKPQGPEPSGPAMFSSVSETYQDDWMPSKPGFVPGRQKQFQPQDAGIRYIDQNIKDGRVLGFSSYIEHFAEDENNDDIISAIKEGSMEDIKRIVPKSEVRFQMFQPSQTHQGKNPLVETIRASEEWRYGYPRGPGIQYEENEIASQNMNPTYTKNIDSYAQERPTTASFRRKRPRFEDENQVVSSPRPQTSDHIKVEGVRSEWKSLGNGVEMAVSKSEPEGNGQNQLKHNLIKPHSGRIPHMLPSKQDAKRQETPKVIEMHIKHENGAVSSQMQHMGRPLQGNQTEFRMQNYADLFKGMESGNKVTTPETQSSLLPKMPTPLKLTDGQPYMGKFATPRPTKDPAIQPIVIANLPNIQPQFDAYTPGPTLSYSQTQPTSHVSFSFGSDPGNNHLWNDQKNTAYESKLRKAADTLQTILQHENGGRIPGHVLDTTPQSFLKIVSPAPQKETSRESILQKQRQLADFSSQLSIDLFKKPDSSPTTFSFPHVTAAYEDALIRPDKMDTHNGEKQLIYNVDLQPTYAKRETQKGLELLSTRPRRPTNNENVFLRGSSSHSFPSESNYMNFPVSASYRLNRKRQDAHQHPLRS